MSFGNKLSELRKLKNINREELGKLVGTSGAMIGKYERNEINPSVEIGKRIADALNVTLDYLVGTSATAIKDKKLVHRIELVQKLEGDDQDRIIYVLDALIKEAQNKIFQKQLE
jgi:transcriptional regulator with XRE-family HTH domain